MVSIKDVAKEANVSTATVSRVINRLPNTSKTVTTAVNSAVKKLGYRVTTNKQSSQMIGALVSDIAEPFFGQMLKGIEPVAKNNGKQLLVYSGDYNAESERNAIERLVRNCDYAVVHTKWLTDSELLDYARQIPGMVLINRYIKAMGHRCIALDNHYGGYIATRHLLNKGHRSIGYLRSEQCITDTSDRLKGHIKALAEAGVKFDDHLVVSCHPSEEGGKLGTYNLLAKKRPLTAIVTYNDVMAAGVLCALNENGIRCPEDISVVGFDDLLVARYASPALSTVRYPVAVMAEQAARLSLELSKPEEGRIEQILIPSFVERSSTQAITPPF